MVLEPPSEQYPSEPLGEVVEELDQLLEELAALGRRSLAPRELYAEFLPKLVGGLAAVGGAVWAHRGEGDWRIDYGVTPPEAAEVGQETNRLARGRLVDGVYRSGQGRVVAPYGGASATSGPENPTGLLLVLAPWVADEDLGGVVEIFQRPGESPSTQRGYLRFVEAATELLADYHRQRRLDEYRCRLERVGQFEQFVQRAYASLDLRATAYNLANESRRYLGCDRASILVRRGRRFRLLAVSGVDLVNRRAGMVRSLERLAKAVVVYGEPLWHPRQTDAIPPEIERRLGAYLDESHARSIGLVPLRLPPAEEDRSVERRSARTPPPAGVLVLEEFRQDPGQETEAAAGPILGHCAQALHKSLEWERLPMARVMRLLGWAGWLLRPRQLPKTLLALALVGGLVAAMILVRADFRVEARGQLQPIGSRDVFAPTDGVVAEVQVTHGEQVQAGQLLLVMRKPELDLEFKRVWGELQTARKKRTSVEAERLQNGRETDEERRRFAQLTALDEELREQIASLEQQNAILQQKQSELEVRSPLAGEILTWDLEPLLKARPVGRGQVLMTIADLRGPWRLELRLPDRRTHHVLVAQEAFGPRLNVDYVLASDPGVRLQGTLERLGTRTEVSESEGTFVLADVEIDAASIPDRMPGASVTARIDCGQQPLGYVWFHDLIDAVRTWLLL